MNFFKIVFSVLVTLIRVPLHETGSSQIFTIVSDTQLQRRIESKIGNLTTNEPSSPISDPARQFYQKLQEYVFLATEAHYEREAAEASKNAEESLPLPDIYVDLFGENMCHDVSFDNFGDFKKSVTRREIITNNASDFNTIKIIYEARVDAITLNGKIDIDDISYGFVLTIYEPLLQAEYERTKTTDHKLKTKSILETFSFHKFTLFVSYTDESKTIASPHKQLLRKLADSWFVTIVDALSERFIEARISKRSEYFLDSFKKSFFDDLCSSFEKQKYMNGSVSSTEQMISHAIYQFADINYDFNNFKRCDGNSVTIKMAEKNDNDEDAPLLHNVFFVFGYPVSYSTYRANINWTSLKVGKLQFGASLYLREYCYLEENKTAVVESLTVKLSLLTTKNGNIRKIYRVGVNIQTRNLQIIHLQNTAADDPEDQYPEIVPIHLANQIESLVKKNILIANE